MTHATRVGVVVLVAAALRSSSAAGQTTPPETPPAPLPPAPRDPEVTALRDEVRALRALVEKGRGDGVPEPAPTPKPLGDESFWPWVIPPEGLSTSAYVQAQYDWSQASQDQLTQSGSTLNQDRFLIRRARLGWVGEWQYVATALELDANTNTGPSIGLRRAEASLQYRPDRARPPLVMATLGLFDVPFGYELVEQSRTRWFMERSNASTAFFPSEPDLGFRLAGAIQWFRWTIAGVNGEQLGEPSPFVLQDPNSAKDVIFRFGFDTSPLEDLNLAGDISALRGVGFHPGTSSTKATLQWTDLNGNGSVDPFELSGVPGQAATPSQNFNRWAVGADLRAYWKWKPGILNVYGEFVIASNMDRGQFIADPVTTGLEQREIGWYVAALQEVYRYGMVGLRYDYYDPNANVFSSQGGRLIPYSETLKTISPLVGLTLPDRARLIFQYDFNTNALALSPTGVPTNLKDNAWTLRLQVQL